MIKPFRVCTHLSAWTQEFHTLFIHLYVSSLMNSVIRLCLLFSVFHRLRVGLLLCYRSSSSCLSKGLPVGIKSKLLCSVPPPHLPSLSAMLAIEQGASYILECCRTLGFTPASFLVLALCSDRVFFCCCFQDKLSVEIPSSPLPCTLPAPAPHPRARITGVGHHTGLERESFLKFKVWNGKALWGLTFR